MFLGDSLCSAVQLMGGDSVVVWRIFRSSKAKVGICKLQDISPDKSLFSQHSSTSVWTQESQWMLIIYWWKAKSMPKFPKRIKLYFSCPEWCWVSGLADDTLSNPSGLLALQVVPQPVRCKSEDADDVEDGKGSDDRPEAAKGLHSDKPALQKLCLLLQPGHLKQEKYQKDRSFRGPQGHNF